MCRAAPPACCSGTCSVPRPRSLHFKLAATGSDGPRECVGLHPRPREVRPPAQGHPAGSGEPGAQDRLPHGPRRLSEHHPRGSGQASAGASYRSPGVGRAPGTRPALVDQLWADAVATWKTGASVSVTAAARGLHGAPSRPRGGVKGGCGIEGNCAHQPLYLNPGHCTQSRRKSGS